VAYEYHSPADLQALGEKIRAKAIQVTMDQSASYGAAQQAANNDATRSDTGQPTLTPGYSTPASGRPDDEDNLRAYVTQSYAQIPDMFAAFALPDPDQARPMLDALHSVAATIHVDLRMTTENTGLVPPAATRPIAGTARVGDVHNLISSHLKGWSGAAATGFELFMNKNGDAATLQRDVALSLALALEAQLEINRRVITDVWDIGQKTFKALEGLDAWCPGANASKSQALLTIGGAIAAVIFAGATAGAGTAALLAAVSVEGWQSLATIWSNTAALEEKKVDIGGMTVPPIISGMQNAMTLLMKSFDAQQQTLAAGLASYNTEVRANWNGLLVPGPTELNNLRGADVTTLRGSDGLHTS
jgi:hypothetical protein